MIYRDLDVEGWDCICAWQLRCLSHSARVVDAKIDGTSAYGGVSGGGRCCWVRKLTAYQDCCVLRLHTNLESSLPCCTPSSKFLNSQV